MSLALSGHSGGGQRRNVAEADGENPDVFSLPLALFSIVRSPGSDEPRPNESLEQLVVIQPN